MFRAGRLFQVIDLPLCLFVSLRVAGLVFLETYAEGLTYLFQVSTSRIKSLCGRLTGEQTFIVLHYIVREEKGRRKTKGLFPMQVVTFLVVGRKMGIRDVRGGQGMKLRVH